jgi:hypothetical protein
MKKLFVLMALVLSIAVVNAQRTTVKVTDLPKGITEYVTKDFAGFTVKDATKIVTNNEVTYETVVAKGMTQETLLFDKDGKFIKKVTAKEGTVGKKNPNPPAKKKAPVKPVIKK